MSNKAQIIEEYFDRKAAYQPEFAGTYPLGDCGYSEILYRHYFEFQHLQNLVSLSKEMTVLELGCGGGRWALSIAPLVKKYIAVDFSRQSLEIAMNRASVKKISNIEFICSSIQEFIPHDNYDLIYFSGVTQYIEDDEIVEILNKLSLCSKPNTVIIDRSTISLGERITKSENNYFSIYRTAPELIDTFRRAGWIFTYRNRSYRFMRFSNIVNLPIINSALPKLILMTQPFSFHIIYILVCLADKTSPAIFEENKFDHCFFVFRKF